MNGTVKATLGICDGLYAARRGPEMTLWVTAAAADYHELERRYAGWRIITSPPADRFGAALRLSQPWQLTEALDLHALAPVNVFLMLDTIAWDVVYPALGGLEKTWRYRGRLRRRPAVHLGVLAPAVSGTIRLVALGAFGRRPPLARSGRLRG